MASLAPAQVAALAELAEVFAVDPRCRTAGELTDAVRGLDRAQGLVEDATLRVWSAWEDTGAYTDDGFAAPAPWLTANLGVRRGRAGFQVGLARKLRTGYPLVGEAAAAGRLGRAKVELLVKARTPDVAEVFDREEADLVDAVEARTVEAAETYLASWRLAVFERLGRNLPDADPGDERESSHLQLSPLLEGRSLVRGELNAADTAIVIGAVNDRIDQWHAAGLLTGDPRSRQELQAAALVELVTDGTAPANRGNGARPLVLALIDADTLSARAAEAYLDWLAQQQGPSGDGGFAWPPGPEPTPPGPAAPPPAGAPTRASRRGDPPRPPGGHHGVPPPWLPPTPPPRRDPASSPRGCTPTEPDPPDPDPPKADPPKAHPPRAHPTRAQQPPANEPGAHPLYQPPDPPPDLPVELLQRIEDHLAALHRFADTSPTVRGRARMPFRSELVGAGPVDPALIEQLVCTGGLTPVLHRNHTEILQMGRTARLATAAQRRALVVRSGGTCEWPGCTIPHSWCDAHHLHQWEHGGPTDLDNLALVCHHHHGRFHQDRFTAVVTATGLRVHRADGTEIVAPLLSRVA